MTSTENAENRNLVASVLSFEKLLKFVESTHSSYDDSLTAVSTSEHRIGAQSISNKNEMKKKIVECKKNMEKIYQRR